MALIKPVIQDESLAAEMDQFLVHGDDFDTWWLGQSGFLLQWKGKRILFDPYLSDSLTRKYASTSKPHIRMSERVIKPELLRGISIVSSSHNHTDHLDAETLQPVLAQNEGIRFVIPEANRSFVADRVKCDTGFPVGLNDGQSVSIGGFRYFGIPAMHNTIDRDEKGCCRYMGYVVSFGKWTVYHSGDTLWFPGMESLLRPFQIDLAFLPINGNDPSREVAGNLDTGEAARLGKAIGARCVIPCHYDMFYFNTANPADFVKIAQTIDQPYAVLSLGERWSSSSLPPV